MRRGLVLGCGGTLGMAWSLAVLAALESAWEWDARSAEVIVGTSAGAELACMLGAGVAVNDLHRAQHGDPDAPAWIAEHLRADPGRFPPRPSLRLGSLGLLARALRGQAPLLAGITGVLPIGRGDPAWLIALARAMAGESEWVAHPATWLVAADFDTGERVAFGSPGAPPATLAEAVHASWGLPSWLPPAQIGGRRFVDGGILSPASPDLVAPLGLEEVIVLAPMASSDPGRPVGVLAAAERVVRRQMTAVLDRECAAVRESGARVRRFEPVGRDLAVMGPNFMDARRRAATLVSAGASTRIALAAS